MMSVLMSRATVKGLLLENNGETRPFGGTSVGHHGRTTTTSWPWRSPSPANSVGIGPGQQAVTPHHGHRSRDTRASPRSDVFGASSATRTTAQLPTRAFQRSYARLLRAGGRQCAALERRLARLSCCEHRNHALPDTRHTGRAAASVEAAIVTSIAGRLARILWSSSSWTPIEARLRTFYPRRRSSASATARAGPPLASLDILRPQPRTRRTFCQAGHKALAPGCRSFAPEHRAPRAHLVLPAHGLTSSRRHRATRCLPRTC